MHPNVAGYWPGCLAVDRMSRQQLLELQQERLNDLLGDVIRHVPWYRRWAEEHGFSAERLPALSDLPVMTKADYIKDLPAFQSDRFAAKELRPAKTSGSSGEPFRFYTHPISTDYGYCALWRAMSRHGLRPGMRRVYVWGQSYRFNADAAAIRKTQWRHQVRNWLNNTFPINAYDLTDHNVHEAIDGIEAFKPVYMHGYVTALYTIARRMVEENRRFRGFAIKAVVTESEKLYDFQRQTMQEAFGCPILEHYGSMELGAMAQADPQGLMRLNEDSYVFETLHTGEAVITNLFSFANPFIRYKLGDLLEINTNPPGSLPYAVLTKVVGRTVDLIPVPTGGYVHGVALAHVVDPHLSYIKKYQIHQLAIDHFQIKLVANELPLAVKERIVKDLCGIIGSPVRVDIEQVEHIAPAASGKFRWVLSDVVDAARTASV